VENCLFEVKDSAATELKRLYSCLNEDIMHIRVTASKQSHDQSILFELVDIQDAPHTENDVEMSSNSIKVSMHKGLVKFFSDLQLEFKEVKEGESPVFAFSRRENV
jgi:Fe-S cluster assembly iron-binding protein IscA